MYVKKYASHWTVTVTNAAPIIWNLLPTHLHSASISRGQFRGELRIYVFSQADT